MYTACHDHGEIGIFLSHESANTLELSAVLSADHELCEAGIADLADSRLVVVTRKHALPRLLHLHKRGLPLNVV